MCAVHIRIPEPQRTRNLKFSINRVRAFFPASIQFHFFFSFVRSFVYFFVIYDLSNACLPRMMCWIQNQCEKKLYCFTTPRESFELGGRFTYTAYFHQPRDSTISNYVKKWPIWMFSLSLFYWRFWIYCHVQRSTVRRGGRQRQQQQRWRYRRPCHQHQMNL